MPPRSEPNKVTWRFYASCALIWLAILVFFPLYTLVAAAFFAGLLLVTLGHERQQHERLKAAAADREGESICTFARSFDFRSIDTWILRGVYEEFQDDCRFGEGIMPLRKSDRFLEDLSIDPEDLSDRIIELAARVGRSLEGFEQNSWNGKIGDAGDLVMFLMNQPRLAIHG
jgi:hypothetical protein